MDGALAYMMGKDAQTTQDQLAQLLEKTDPDNMMKSIVGKLQEKGMWTPQMQQLLGQFTGNVGNDLGLGQFGTPGSFPNWASLPSPSQGNLGLPGGVLAANPGLNWWSNPAMANQSLSVRRG